MKKKKSDYAAKLERGRAEARELATQLRSLLSGDPDWSLATDRIISEKRQRLSAITRITKKAVRLMYPDYKCSVRRGRGTGHSWVDVNVVVPELIHQGADNTRTWKRKFNLKDNICRRIENTLVALGIAYSHYNPDYGPGSNEPQPCLSVHIEDI